MNSLGCARGGGNGGHSDHSDDPFATATTSTIRRCCYGPCRATRTREVRGSYDSAIGPSSVLSNIRPFVTNLPYEVHRVNDRPSPTYRHAQNHGTWIFQDGGAPSLGLEVARADTSRPAGRASFKFDIVRLIASRERIPQISYEKLQDSVQYNKIHLLLLRNSNF